MLIRFRTSPKQGQPSCTAVFDSEYDLVLMLSIDIYPPKIIPLGIASKKNPEALYKALDKLEWERAPNEQFQSYIMTARAWFKGLFLVDAAEGLIDIIDTTSDDLLEEVPERPTLH